MDNTQGHRHPTQTHNSLAIRSSFSFPHSISLSMSRYPEVSLGFVRCSTIRLFGFTSPTRASKGATTTVTHRIQRRASNRTMLQILSRTPKTTHALSRQATRHQPLRSTNRIIHLPATILLTCPTANHPHQITTTHTLHLLILFTRFLHHRHRHRPFISNRSSSNSLTLLSPRTNLSTLPTSTSLTHL